MLVLVGLMVVFGAAGAVLLWAGLRGRMINDHPICRRCRFDLLGVYPDVECCPECGRSLSTSGGVRLGARTRRSIPATAGAVILAAAALAIGTGAWSMARDANPYLLAPDWYLLLVANTHPSSWSEDLAVEIGTERILTAALRDAAHGGRARWGGELRLDRFPTNLVAELWVVQDRHEIPVGAILSTTRAPSEGAAWRILGGPPRDLEGAKLVLRPRLDLARIEKDVREVWGKEIAVPLE